MVPALLLFCVSGGCSADRRRHCVRGSGDCGRGPRAREGLRDGVESAIRAPLFAWTVRLNALSAWFQLALSLLAAAVSVYSFGYLRKMEGLTQSRNSRLLVQRDAAQPHAGVRRCERPSFSFWRGDLRSTYANFFGISRKLWSGRGDLNSRPPAPKAGALPGCATPRHLKLP